MLVCPQRAFCVPRCAARAVHYLIPSCHVSYRSHAILTHAPTRTPPHVPHLHLYLPHLSLPASTPSTTAAPLLSFMLSSPLTPPHHCYLHCHTWHYPPPLLPPTHTFTFSQIPSCSQVQLVMVCLAFALPRPHTVILHALHTLSPIYKCAHTQVLPPAIPLRTHFAAHALLLRCCRHAGGDVTCDRTGQDGRTEDEGQWQTLLHTTFTHLTPHTFTHHHARMRHR